MKTIILIAIISFSLNVSAQITLEQTYDSASTIGNSINGGILSQLMIIKFEVSGERYVNINRFGKNISIYDMNHVLLKTISLTNLPLIDNYKIGDILYLSENLFDTDSKIEFMYALQLTGDSWYTGIYNEDGSLIFSDIGAALIYVNTPLQQFPIYNTSQGTKMILSYPNFQAKVFSLPGQLSTSIAEANWQLIQTQNGQLGSLYPNPGNGTVTLQYQLPRDEQNGEIVLYNMQGAEVRRYKVNNTFKDLLLDNSQLQAGTYFYQLQTSKGAVGVKKMVVVK